MMPKRLLAIIPARSGSKRLPGKNVRLLGGLPLIAWTIRSAAESGVFFELLVSTDDKAIADVAVQHGASVPWLRPAELASDTASSIDVVLHAIDAYESIGATIDSVMLLQPTSPFRSADVIKSAVVLHERSAFSPVVSVCSAKSHPDWCFRIAEDGVMHRYLSGNDVALRSQDLPTAYQLNGALYLATTNDLRSERSFITSRTRALVMHRPEESVDIDDPWDWKMAECIAASISEEN